MTVDTGDSRTFDTIWDAVAKDASEAASLKKRAELMRFLIEHIRSMGWTQTEAAAQLGVKQPHISELMHGKIGRFGLGGLVTMIDRLGMDITIKVHKPRRPAASSRKAA